MKRLDIIVLDLVTNGPTRALYPRLMNANLASIMSQVVAVWAEELGHRVQFASYTGAEDLGRLVSRRCDVVIIGAFTRSAQLAYALSGIARKSGAVTVLGGPHARCYPDDACRYFDYVLGFTDKTLLAEVLGDCSPRRPRGLSLAALAQPADLPPLRQRWKFVEANLRKAPPGLKIVPLISSLGCPYRCSFCIDSTVAFQPLDRGQLADDLAFLGKTMPGAIVGWHDPNFGVRFDEYLTTIEEATHRRPLRHLAESSLSLLSEKNVRRMAAAGFAGLLPGIESWFDMGYKSKTGNREGMDKVLEIAAHVNMILEHVPFVQTNFVLGLDTDIGPEPFELTKRFLDLAPGAFPAYSQRTAFGEATPENLQLQRDGRVLGFPHHLLDNNTVMNVVPRNYRWKEFYGHMLGLTAYSFSRRAVYRRFRATRGVISRVVNFARAVSNEGRGRVRHFQGVLRAIGEDAAVRAYLAQESQVLPQLYVDRIRRDLGPFWEHLPAGALEHDAYAFLARERAGKAGRAVQGVPETSL